jgi:hypothetical protein
MRYAKVDFIINPSVITPFMSISLMPETYLSQYQYKRISRRCQEYYSSDAKLKKEVFNFKNGTN